MGEGHERLAGEVTDSLAAVRATHDHEANVRVGDDVRDQTLCRRLHRRDAAFPGWQSRPGLRAKETGRYELEVDGSTVSRVGVAKGHVGCRGVSSPLRLRGKR